MQLPVKCKVEVLSFSAHADFEQTSGFLDALQPPHVVLVHGERGEMMKLKGVRGVGVGGGAHSLLRGGVEGGYGWGRGPAGKEQGGLTVSWVRGEVGMMPQYPRLQDQPHGEHCQICDSRQPPTVMIVSSFALARRRQHACPTIVICRRPHSLMQPQLVTGRLLLPLSPPSAFLSGART
jgi:hypothetical protein